MPNYFFDKQYYLRHTHTYDDVSHATICNYSLGIKEKPVRSSCKMNSLSTEAAVKFIKYGVVII